MRAEIETIRCGFVNVFIVRNERSAILVDTAMENDRYDILKKARDAGVSLIVLTHVHPDHAENARYLSENLGIPIAMGEGDLPLIADQDAIRMYSRDLIGASILKKKNGPIPQFKPSIFLSEGDSLEPYGIDARIIELPGHTDGSIGILVENKALIVGDALMNMVHPSLPHLYHDERQMKESAMKISALGDIMIYFGHGKEAMNRNWVRHA